MTSMAQIREQQPFRIGFLLVDGFTTLALGSAIEPLRTANLVAGRQLYQWHTLSVNKRPVHTSEGLLVAPDAATSQHQPLDCLLVVAGDSFQHQCTNHHIRWLTSFADQAIVLGSLCRGAFLLAAADLLNGHRISAHPQCLQAIRRHFPKVLATDKAFHLASTRLTCAGGTAPLQAMLNLVGQHHGEELAEQVALQVLPSYSGRTEMSESVEEYPEKLRETIALMENNIEEPIALDELANYVSISRRQLERLFQKHLAQSPSRYYLKARLARARQLLKHTSLPILDVANACGFISTPHFSRVYRENLGLTPRDERRNDQAAPIMETNTKASAVSPESTNEARRYYSPFRRNPAANLSAMG
ncbi:GlxA family transcriptional regulator [Halioxenophilus sp. WMMB6]|uniref:GlxA family transcriptional regulator n=1 Tax=Halioxenophilus sp. WMMB6 TaxID=3073815 RepID=UPI00295ED3C9|nr:GlxA family transcriptional regulator [Halioxenophilus sp. WMMB6]